MPHFNEFRMNEVLLGEIIVAKKKSDFYNNIEDDLEARQFLITLEEEKRSKSKSIILRVMEKVTGKNLIEFQNDRGKKSMREYNPDIELIKPEVKLSHTIKPSIDFQDDINAWREYIHEENIKDEERWIEREKQERFRKTLVETYSDKIMTKMMRIN